VLKINSSQVDNISPVNIGASDQNSVVGMDYSEWNMGGGSVQIITDSIDTKYSEDELAQVCILDDEVDKKYQNKIDLIKIDVEGHELNALKGMTSILKSSKPIVIIEQHGDDIVTNTSGYLSSPCIDFLKECEYTNVYEIAFVDDLIDRSGYFFAKILKLRNLIKYKKHRFYEVKKVVNLEKKFYPMLLLSKHDIIGQI
jgi:FkbM family methyltransferase